MSPSLNLLFNSRQSQTISKMFCLDHQRLFKSCYVDAKSRDQPSMVPNKNKGKIVVISGFDSVQSHGNQGCVACERTIREMDHNTGLSTSPTKNLINQPLTKTQRYSSGARSLSNRVLRQLYTHLQQQQ